MNRSFKMGQNGRTRSAFSLGSNKSSNSHKTSEEEFRIRSYDSGKTYLDPKTGTVVTLREVVQKRTASGLCISCGRIKTHKKRLGGYKMVPLNTEGVVSKGVCLKCFPEPNEVEENHIRASMRSKESDSNSRNLLKQEEVSQYIKVTNLTNITNFLDTNEDGELALAAIAEIANLTEEEYKCSTKNQLNLLLYRISKSSHFIKDTVRLREEICQIIWKLSFYGDNTRKKELYELGCGSSILRFLDGSHLDDEVFRRACRALSSLVEEESNRNKVLDEDVLQQLNSVATNKMVSSITIVEVLKVITALFGQPNTLSKEDAKSASNSAKYAMKHKRSHAVQRCGLDLFHTISINFKDIYNIYDVGPLIFSTLTLHDSDISMKRKGIQIFINQVEETGNFYLQNDIMDDIHAYFSSQMVVNSKNQSPDHLEFTADIFMFYNLLLSNNILDDVDIAIIQLVDHVDTVMTSCKKTGAMRTLCTGMMVLNLCSKDAVSSCDPNNVIEIIEEVMKDQKTDPTMFYESMQMLQTVINDEDSAALLQKTTIVDMIMDAIRGNKEDSKVIVSAFSAIQPMSMMSNCRVHLEENSVFDIVLSVISSSNNESTIIQGMRILSNLSIHPESLQATLISLNNLKTVLSTMQNYPDIPDVQLYGCTLFRNALLKDQNIPTLQALGEDFVDILLLASEKHPSNCKEHVTTVLQVVFRKK